MMNSLLLSEEVGDALGRPSIKREESGWLCELTEGCAARWQGLSRKKRRVNSLLE